MKIKYILTSLVAVCALAIGCTKEQKVTLLDEIQVSKSIVALGDEPCIVDVTAKSDWAVDIKAEDVPSWVRISPLSGQAGTTKMQFEKGEPSTKPYESLTLKFNCGGKTLLLLVQLGNPKPINDEDNPFTPDEAIAYFKENGTGASFYVKGVVRTSKIDTGYGNAEFYLVENDPDYDFEFYRCLDLGENKFTKADKVKVGDTVVGFGTLTKYNSTIEFAQGCYLTKIIKAEIELKNPQDLNAPKEGAELQAKLVVNGDDFRIDVKNDWLSIGNIETIPATYDDRGRLLTPQMSNVHIKVAANNGAPRAGAIVFASGEASEVTANINQEGAKVDIKDVKENNPCYVEGQVTAICARGFILTDNTASILYYNASNFDPSKYKIGDKYGVACSKVTSYNGALQLEVANVTNLSKISAGTYEYPAAAAMDKAALDEFVSKSTKDFAKLISFTAKTSISGNYYNYFITDGDTNGFSLYQGTNDQKAEFENGKTYSVTGYLVSRSSGKYANFVLVSATQE